MSGSSIPYHLRTNKVIERKIFFDLLFHLNTILPNRIQEYRYFSMGGPMLEDHQLLHHQLGMRKLVSIERDSAALERQEFNKPFSCIECKKQNASDFVKGFDQEEEPSIVWLDYTDTKWSTQFVNCYDLLLNLKVNDIFKVTFNANPDVLETPEEEKLEVFKRRANCKWISENLIDNDVKTMPNFALTISTILKSLAEDVLSSDDIELKPLTEFRYIDNAHQMYTFCGILVDKGDKAVAQKIEKLKGSEFPYLKQAGDEIAEIAVPTLTQKEKFEINKLLPQLCEKIDITKIPFRLDKNSSIAERMLRNYVEYYRYIPNFQKIAV